MPTMTIRTTNSTFSSVSTGDFETVEDAYRAGVVAGVDIAAGEVAAGALSSLVQVEVDLVGQRGVARGAVAVSTARLLSTQAPIGGPEHRPEPPTSKSVEGGS